MSRPPRLVIVGSVNMDVVVRVARHPSPGETIQGFGLLNVPGGKGANQAVAAARWGAEATMIGAVGDDAFGQTLRNALAAESVCVDTLRVVDECPSGVALISVDEQGENAITVVGGANHRWEDADWSVIEHRVREADAVLLQLEIPLEVVERVVEWCRRHETISILDPAPAPSGPLASGLAAVDVLTPNQSEAQALTGIEVKDRHGAVEAARKLLAGGAGRVIVKLGAAGAVHLRAGEEPVYHAAAAVDVVDTTAAGDAFTAALAVGLVQDLAVPELLRRACAAGTLATQRHGAQPSLPTSQAVFDWLNRPPE